jgi:DNA-binding winged helix-turn-helix (wHTH) protein
VLEREEIYSRLWGYAMVRGDRSVDVFVRKLRQKLEKFSPRWRYIHTHFGIGYRFAAEPIGVVASEAVAGEASVEAIAGGATASELDLDVRDQRELDGTQQEHQLAGSTR